MPLLNLYRKKQWMISLLFCLFINSIVIAQSNNQIESMKLLMDGYQYNDAIKLADTYLAADSTNSNIIYYKGKAQSFNYMYRNAIISYTKAYTLDSLNIDLLEDITKTYQLLGDDDNAIKYSLKIVKLKPDNYFFKVQLANIYFTNLNYKEAIRSIIPLSVKDTTNVHLLKMIGNSYTELKYYDSAIYYYNKALILMPSDLFINQKLTNLYIKSKEYNKGLAVSECYLKKDSTNAEMFLLKGYCLYLLKNYSNAVEPFMRSMDLGKDTKFIYKYLGLSFYKMEIYGLAEKYLDIAYQKDSTDVDLCFYLGVSSCKWLKPDTGIYYLNKTMTMIMPTNQFLTSLYLEMAEACNYLSKFDTALVLIKKAYQLDSLNSTVVFRIAYQYDSWMMDQEQAIFYYDKYLKIESEQNKNEGENPISASTISFVNGRLESLYKKKK